MMKAWKQTMMRKMNSWQASEMKCFKNISREELKPKKSHQPLIILCKKLSLTSLSKKLSLTSLKKKLSLTILSKKLSLTILSKKSSLTSLKKK
jgi:hypothetical protein